MISKFLEWAIILIGLLGTGLLFYRIPYLPKWRDSQKESSVLKISVIIPLRNEENTIPLLLMDLQRQNRRPDEIICVDDDSQDDTNLVVQSYPVTLLSLKEKPAGWIGKSWACFQGAKKAKGDIFLFLDADVRFGPNGLDQLLRTYSVKGKPLSVQPYHRTEKAYEQFSLPFNVVQLAANGMALPKPAYIGLFGPIVMMGSEHYWSIGGHESVKNSIVEDLDLGMELKRHDIPYDLYLGDPEISYRMYGNGFSGLYQGWTKNQMAGAKRTKFWVFLLVFFWVSSLISVPLQFLRAWNQGQWVWVLIYGILYLAWAILLWRISSKVGKFQRWSVVFYPVLMVVYLWIFFTSLIKGFFGLSTPWKGRDVDGRSDP